MATMYNGVSYADFVELMGPLAGKKVQLSHLSLPGEGAGESRYYLTAVGEDSAGAYTELFNVRLKPDSSAGVIALQQVVTDSKAFMAALPDFYTKYVYVESDWVSTVLVVSGIGVALYLLFA